MTRSSVHPVHLNKIHTIGYCLKDEDIVSMSVDITCNPNAPLQILMRSE
jgi:hypothetical protein